MKATFDGQDYMLIFDKDAGEFRQLRRGSQFEAPLTRPFQGDDLGKVVSVEFSDNNEPDGIELRYLPGTAQSWEEIQRVHVKINVRAYNHIEERGTFGTRYDSIGNKIEIFNGMPGA